MPNWPAFRDGLHEQMARCTERATASLQPRQHRSIVVDEGKRHETAFAAVLRALHMGKISPEPVQSGSRKSDTVASLLATKAVQQMVQDGSLVELGEVRKHLTGDSDVFRLAKY